MNVIDEWQMAFVASEWKRADGVKRRKQTKKTDTENLNAETISGNTFVFGMHMPLSCRL